MLIRSVSSAVKRYESRGLRRVGEVIGGVLAAAILVSAPIAPAVVRAGDPYNGGEPAGDRNVVLPITPEVRAALEKKMPAFNLVAAATSSPALMNAAALPSSYTLSTHARHQHRSYYCGPATVQIV